MLVNIFGTMTATVVKACVELRRFSNAAKNIRVGGLEKPVNAFRDLLQVTRCCADRCIPQELKMGYAPHHSFEECSKGMQQEFCKLGVAKMIYKYEAPLLDAYKERIQSLSLQIQTFNSQLDAQISKIFGFATALFATDISDYLSCQLAKKYRFKVLKEETTKITLAVASIALTSCFTPINVYEAVLGYAIKRCVNKIMTCANTKISQ